jgi:hypothetical protein
METNAESYPWAAQILMLMVYAAVSLVSHSPAILPTIGTNFGLDII